MPQRPLHCFAYLQNGIWGAICLDLDISVQGDTLEDVKASLAAAVDAYALSARAEDSKMGLVLMRRKARFSVRAQCHARYLFATVLQPRKVPAEHAEFVLFRRQ
jgi:hypothetical protein